MEVKIKEFLYNTFGWRLSDREEKLLQWSLLLSEEARMDLIEQHEFKLSEREDHIIHVTKEFFNESS